MRPPNVREQSHIRDQYVSRPDGHAQVRPVAAPKVITTSTSPALEFPETPSLSAEQLGSWGDAKRDPRGWSATHAYFALISSQQIVLRKGANAADVEWCAVIDDEVKRKLAFDHADILRTAIARLRSKVEYTSLPAYLLPEEFTLSDLQRMYEIVLGRSVEKSAFRTRVNAAGLVEPVPRVREGPNRPAQLYRLKEPGQLVYFPRTFNPPRD